MNVNKKSNLTLPTADKDGNTIMTAADRLALQTAMIYMRASYINMAAQCKVLSSAFLDLRESPVPNILVPDPYEIDVLQISFCEKYNEVFHYTD